MRNIEGWSLKDMLNWLKNVKKLERWNFEKFGWLTGKYWRKMLHETEFKQKKIGQLWRHKINYRNFPISKSSHIAVDNVNKYNFHKSAHQGKRYGMCVWTY